MLHHLPGRHLLCIVFTQHDVDTVDQVRDIKHTNVPTSDNVWCQVRLCPVCKKRFEQLHLIDTLGILNLATIQLVFYLRFLKTPLTSTPYEVSVQNTVLQCDSGDWVFRFIWFRKSIIRLNLNVDIADIDFIRIEWDLPAREEVVNEL